MTQRLSLTLLVCLTLAAPAAAGPGPVERLRDDWRQLLAEGAIERSMALAELRGRLAPRPPAPDWTPRRSGQGRLERGPGGVPILYLEGTPEEMGRQHGELMRGELHALQAYVRAFVGRRELPAARRRAAALFRERCPTEYLREAEALAAAAGMSAEDVLFAQWFTDVYRAFACSTLSAPSAEGALLARNLDFPSMGFLERYSLVVVARPQGKRPFVSVSWPGLIGVLSGQSQALALAVMVVHDDSGAQPGLPFQLAFRRVLEQAASAAEAEALLRATPLTCTNNLMVVDAAGDARVLELHPDGVVSRHPDAGGRLVSTNHFVSPERREPRVTLGYLSSWRRYRAVERACPEGPLTLSIAQRALRDASVPYTVQSMVFLPREGAVEVAFSRRAPATDAPFVRLGRDLLLGESVVPEGLRRVVPGGLRPPGSPEAPR